MNPTTITVAASLARGMMRTNTGEITRVVTGHVAADLAHSWAYSDEGVFTSQNVERDVKRKTVFVCEECGNHHDTEAAAEQCAIFNRQSKNGERITRRLRELMDGAYFLYDEDPAPGEQFIADVTDAFERATRHANLLKSAREIRDVREATASDQERERRLPGVQED